MDIMNLIQTWHGDELICWRPLISSRMYEVKSEKAEKKKNALLGACLKICEVSYSTPVAVTFDCCANLEYLS